jgi:hypothetical protein
LNRKNPVDGNEKRRLMNAKDINLKLRLGGIHILCASRQAVDTAHEEFMGSLQELGLAQYLEISEAGDGQLSCRFQLREDFANEYMPDFDTTQLCQKLDLDSENKLDDLQREVLLTMLRCPIGFEFPSHAELASAVRVRMNIVKAGRRTALSFKTNAAERPADCWTYTKGRSFTVLPGNSLITSLQKATQPDLSGTLYSFSCYRATEYVILLGLAEELARCNPALSRQLQQQWENRAIMSGEFHEVFLHEYGSMTEPLPVEYYVPGDRLWFRNPDDHSSDVTGYEGSWVVYLGGGLFTNFWKRDEPYTLTSKCLEIFHWRHATCQSATGDLQIDESIVEARVQQSMQDPAEVERIMQIMLRLRDPQGVYADGGCIDTSREYPRCICPGTADLVLPEH